MPGHAFALEQPEGGKLDGRAIDTLGYRGMHSYEVSFSDWFVPAENLVGEAGGLGKGFYLQMEGFENGRLQTAARAVGLMQAAFDAGLAYAQDRNVFGKPVFDVPAQPREAGADGRAHRRPGVSSPTTSPRRMGRGEGTLSASMVKAYVCRSAEWVTREAMQLHGGMGYAEEFPVSRYFVDARVLSIFEGADETLCLRVIARRLAEQALSRARARRFGACRRARPGSRTSAPSCGWLRRSSRRRTSPRRAGRLSQNCGGNNMRILITGAGEVGYLIASELYADHDVTVIDKDPAACARLQDMDVKVSAGQFCQCPSASLGRHQESGHSSSRNRQ